MAKSEASTFCEAMSLTQKFIQALDICKTHKELSKRKNDHPTQADTSRMYVEEIEIRSHGLTTIGMTLDITSIKEKLRRVNNYIFLTFSIYSY